MKKYLSVILIYFLVCFVIALTGHYPAARYGTAYFALLATIYVGLRWNEMAGILFGLAVGLTTLFYDGGSLNLSVMVYPATGWLAGMLPGHVNASPLPIQLILVLFFIAIAALVYSLFHGGDFTGDGFLQAASALFSTVILAAILFPTGDRAFNPPRSRASQMKRLRERPETGSHS